MTDAKSQDRLPLGRDRGWDAVRRWRSLTGGAGRRDGDRKTLVACSGGADSAALLIVLGSTAAAGSIIAGHVVHDMRAEAQARSDADRVRSLAQKLGLASVERRITARAEGGNLEAASRRLRYQALAHMAREHGCRYVATGHHADDQLETVLMRLLRGAGPAGLAGISPKRRIDRASPAVALLRPMLGLVRTESEAICRAWGFAWAEDATNADLSRVRSALRHRVLPILAELRSDGSARAAQAADLCRLAWQAIEQDAGDLLAHASAEGDGVMWLRAQVRSAAVVVATQALRRAILRASGNAARDRITQRSLLAAVRAIRDASGEVRTFQWRGATVRVDSARVTVRPGAVRELSGPGGDSPAPDRVV